MNDDEFETKGNKTWCKNQIKPQKYTSILVTAVFIITQDQNTCISCIKPSTIASSSRSSGLLTSLSCLKKKTEKSIYIPSSDILITLAKLLYNLKEVSWQTGVLNLRIPLNQQKRQNLNSQTWKQERKINTFPV